MSRTDGALPAGRASLLRAQDGFSIVEVLAAILILVVGILGLVGGFTVSQKLSLSSERQSSMARVAQGEIERVEGLSYASVALTTSAGTSTDPQNPDYYVVSGSTPTFEWNRTAASAEPLDVDTTQGAVAPVQSWSQGSLSGSIYDFVTWSNDADCGPGCPSSEDYKRVTVAVTVSGTNSPSPVYVSSVITDPNATPAQGTANGTSGNPITSGGTTCAAVSGTTTTPTSCESPIDSGTPNAFFLHDCPATASTCTAPTSSHTTDSTVGTVYGLVCATGLTSLVSVLATLISGCPTPDKMNTTPPTGTTSTYQYSTDISTVGYAGGRLLAPLCPTSGPCGTDTLTDCNGAVAWVNNLVNDQNELWVTPPVSTATTLTGEGAMNLFTQTWQGTPAVVSLCVELYAIPPSGGIPGSLADLLSFSPTAVGGATYVPVTNPSTGSNWPTSPSNLDFVFNFAPGGATIPAGDRIGLRVWMVGETNNDIALLYDSQTYPSEIQLNSQSTIQFTGS